MAESDPKKLRAFGQNSDRRSSLSEEDPLVELARIVSEDGGFSGPKPQPPKLRRDEPADRNAHSADLEAELLQELETSFNARQPEVPPVSHPAPIAAASRPADDSEDLLRSIERQLGDFERRTAHRSRQPTPVRHAETAWDAPAESDVRYEAENVAPEPVDDWSPEEPAARFEPEQHDETFAPQAAAWGDPDARTDAPHSGGRFGRQMDPPPADPDRFADDEVGDPPLLRRRDQPDFARSTREDGLGPVFAAGGAQSWNTVSANENSAGAAGGQAQWRDARADLRTTFGGLDDTREPARGYDTVQRIGGGAPAELEANYSDPTFGGEWQDARDQEGIGGSDEPRVSAAAAVIASGMHRAARPAEHGTSRRTLLTVVAVLGAVLIGGALAAYLRSGADAPAGPPPVIAADEGAVKVEAPQQQAEGETVGQAVYDRVAGNAPGTEEQVVEGAEEPREVARIVLPAPQADADAALVKPVGDDPAAAGEPAPGESAPQAVSPTEADVGPRRVRTYVVQADGTVVARDPAATPPAEQQVASASPVEIAPIEPVPVPTVQINGQAPSAPANSADPNADPSTTDLSAQDPAAPPAGAVPTTDIAVAPVAPDPAAPPEPVAAPVPAPSAGGGGYLVQLSSQRSMDQAQSSFAAMQNSYPTVLGGLQPDIQQADLGLQGIYYRVRVGPWTTRAEAVEVCEALQAVGGNCFVTQ